MAVLCISLVFLIITVGRCTENFKRSVKLSSFYELDWEVDFQTEAITFEVRAKTSGFVGFGLNHNGGMIGADIVIGGVNSDCGSYFTDRHGVGVFEPVIDTSQDWFLSCASETWEDNGPLTTLKFTRKFITCDSEDIPITNDTLYVIFSIGETDEIRYHGSNRGAKAINLLDPPNPKVDLSKLEKWQVGVRTAIPNQNDTVYWCTIHKAPRFRQKAHMVGFEAILDSEPALRYTHHMALHRCVTLKGSNLPSVMDPNLYPRYLGNECYIDPHVMELYTYCGVYLFVWARGGESLLIPEHVGFPIGDDPNVVDEYFLLEVHYDNPTKDAGLQFLTGINVYYNYDLRPNDAGLLIVGSEPKPTLLVPPNQQEFVIAGHCSPSCTALTFPDEGINIFNVLLHSHLSGRKLKLRHFRGSQELPWVSYDNSYNFNFQQNRPTREEVHIRKGDHLTFECTYNTAWKGDGTVVVGGFSTKEEMCDAFMLYYPLMKDLDICVSGPGPVEDIFAMFGIKAHKPEYIVEAPEHLKGMRYEDVLNTRVAWTDDFIETFRQRARYGTHFQSCISYRVSLEDMIKLPPTVTYPPGLVEFEPLDECRNPLRDPTTYLPADQSCPCCHASSSFFYNSKSTNFSIALHI